MEKGNDFLYIFRWQYSFSVSFCVLVIIPIIRVTFENNTFENIHLNINFDKLKKLDNDLDFQYILKIEYFGNFVIP